MHPVYNVQDWDSAEGAIDWTRMVKAMDEVRLLTNALKNPLKNLLPY